MQSVPSETITQILKTHAYETDFRRRLRSGDTCEMFFDLKDEGGTEGPPGELLYTSITTGGETTRYYRYRTPDGKIDYYDAAGNNAKKFLMRKPVRSDDSRLTSGFGLRFHPLLNEKRMHTGVDWASTPGTPILAAGNGTIEEAGRKGQYGNYIRIRHANGYQTAYGHMSRLAQGAAPGVKVRQGQVIGFVGSTGLSSGPHLHFEVLVNNQFVDPMSIQVPREHQLVERELGEFQKERARIDDLMRRAPVLTASK
jgi:murein DD-endopeptidase MepM/ murein hydrolase activator NlpD